MARPSTTLDFGQFEAESSQFLSGGFGVALSSLSVPFLVAGNFFGSLVEELFRGASVKPPGPHHGTHCGVDLTHGQFRIFFSARLLAFEPEITD